jgi:hypothetical protein
LNRTDLEIKEEGRRKEKEEKRKKKRERRKRKRRSNQSFFSINTKTSTYYLSPSYFTVFPHCQPLSSSKAADVSEDAQEKG